MEQCSVPDPTDGVAAAWPDAVVVARLRARDERAAAELYARFAPLLLDEARRRRVDAGVRREVVMDTIGAAALVLMRSDTPVPGSLAGYLVTALRRRVLNLARGERLARLRAADVEMPPRVGDTDAPHVVSAPVARLARVLEQHLREDERQILMWLGDRVPQSEIAVWLGSTYGAVRVRVMRLRERLREIARRHAAALPPDERDELERFLRRVAPAKSSPSADARRASGDTRHGSR